MALTFQSGAYTNDSSKITDYALFLGGLDVTRQALEQYDPLRTGFGRIFMIRKPIFLTKNEEYRKKLDKFKHILEYANTGASGNNNIQMNFNSMQGGYTNRQLEIPNVATDDSNELTIKTYEFSGSPVREVIQLWMNGVSDFQSGFAHYYGEAANLGVKQSNHTAEFIYAVTDPSGQKVEYAALFANCFPKEVKLDQFNYDSGTHELVQMDVSFTCTRYMSPAINKKAEQLIKKYNILVNSLNFSGGLSDVGKEQGTHYDRSSGRLMPSADDNAEFKYAYQTPSEIPID